MFDTLNNKGITQQSDDYKFFVNLLNVHTDSRALNRAAWNITYTSAVKNSGTLNNNVDTDKGYTIEIKIPWSNWGIDVPTTNTKFGFELMMNDQDSTDTRSYSVWSNLGGGNVNTPDAWGEIVFSDYKFYITGYKHKSKESRSIHRRQYQSSYRN
jgi:hypothetical protein